MLTLGHCFRNIGQFENSMIWYDMALTIDYENKEILNAKGISLIQLRAYFKIKGLTLRMLDFL